MGEAAMRCLRDNSPDVGEPEKPGAETDGADVDVVASEETVPGSEALGKHQLVHDLSSSTPLPLETDVANLFTVNDISVPQKSQSSDTGLLTSLDATIEHSNAESPLPPTHRARGRFARTSKRLSLTLSRLFQLSDADAMSTPPRHVKYELPATPSTPDPPADGPRESAPGPSRLRKLRGMLPSVRRSDRPHPDFYPANFYEPTRLSRLLERLGLSSRRRSEFTTYSAFSRKTQQSDTMRMSFMYTAHRARKRADEGADGASEGHV
ncbi:hypothetical protein FA95DRAFT_1560281 [Auriscalpium vulgare]|uniref:Uncharacterized protein n=1 Tax=Auriscalpium vulgare TaxID=40419 RepID=A0ACB8RQ69_9AGAM|nr:hypothetical protein FA95DRAFT_1560281 [Auriscalpium vulgare]